MCLSLEKDGCASQGQIYVVCDTGSSHTYIEIPRNCTLASSSNAKRKMVRTIGGRAVRTRGTTRIKIPGYPFGPVLAHIIFSEKYYESHKVILGRDVICRNGAVADLAEGTVKIEGEKPIPLVAHLPSWCKCVQNSKAAFALAKQKEEEASCQLADLLEKLKKNKQEKDLPPTMDLEDVSKVVSKTTQVRHPGAPPVTLHIGEGKHLEKTASALLQLMDSHPELMTRAAGRIDQRIIQVSIKTKPDIKGFVERCGRQNPKAADEKAKQCEDMHKKGFIRRAGPSQTVSRCFLVPKPDGTKRLVIDSRTLNKNVVEDKYLSVRLEDALDLVRTGKIFSKLDAEKGFFQLLVHPKDRHLTAFTDGTSLWECVGRPMGFKNAPACFSRSDPGTPPSSRRGLVHRRYPCILTRHRPPPRNLTTSLEGSTQRRSEAEGRQMRIRRGSRGISRTPRHAGRLSIQQGEDTRRNGHRKTNQRLRIEIVPRHFQSSSQVYQELRASRSTFDATDKQKYPVELDN